MPTKALVLLLAFFLLLLPFLTTERAVTLPTTVTPEATGEVTPVPEATQEATPAPTAEGTAETTPAPTAEATPEATDAPETTLEPTLGAELPMLVGDVANGEVIYTSGLRGAPACINCHSTTATGKNGFALGPGLRGIHELAATRVEGQTAEIYIENSIRHPADYLVAGFRDIMYASFDTDYSDQEIADLVAYLMTL